MPKSSTQPTHPPHLPAKSCSVLLRQRIRRAVLFFGLVIIAFLSGVSATLAVYAWVLPRTPTTFSNIVLPQTKITVRFFEDEAYRRDIMQRTVRLYDARKQISGVWQPAGSAIADALLLSADGWAVAYAPNLRALDALHTIAIDAGGQSFSVASIVSDARSGYVYIRLEGDGFRVSDIESGVPADGEHVAIFSDDRWIDARLAALEFSNSTLTLASAWSDHARLGFDASVPEGGLVFRQNGSFVGSIAEDGTLVPSVFVRLQLGRLLQGETPEYESVPWQGVFVSRVERPNRIQAHYGWYVTRAPKAPSPTAIGFGDLIVAVNGIPTNPATFASDIFRAPHEFFATVLRNGQEIDILVEKQVL